jgi:hypothetical protein
VLAARVAVGVRDDRSADAFELGGTSGGSFSLFPGLGVGGGPRTFGVRGFPAATQLGTRAIAGSLEYRAPLFAPSRGIGLIPVFFDRASVSLFGDAGQAYCPAVIPDRAICFASDTVRQWLASVGGEINLDASIPYDSPYRFRLGAAVPVAGRERYGVKGATAYLTVGAAF